MIYNDHERRGDSMKEIHYQNTTSSCAVEAYMYTYLLRVPSVKISGKLLLKQFNFNEFNKLRLAVLNPTIASHMKN